MNRMPACPLAVVALAVALAAGQEPGTVAARSVRAIEELAEPVRARAAADTLIALGAEVVSPLCALVQAPQRYVEPPPRVLGALYVLGRLGARALPALPVLESAAADRDWAIADQALWALAEVGQHAPTERREQLVQAIGSRRYTARIAADRLQLGLEPDPDQLRHHLCAADPAAVAAACLQLAGQPWRDPALRADLRVCLRTQLTAALELAPAWNPSPLRPAASVLGAAWLQLDGNTDNLGGEAELLVGRALLRHFDAALRRRSLRLVRGLGDAQLTVRAEVLPLLADADAEIRQLAVWTFQGFGQNGLLALPQLRRLQRLDGDVGVRMACTTVADELLAAVDAPAVRAFLADVDARLRGAVTTRLAMPPAACEPALLQVLCGAEWADKAVVDVLLPEPLPGAVVGAELFGAVLRFCLNVDPELRRLAEAWLVRHGRAALPLQLEAMVLGIAQQTGDDDAGIYEMLAWLRAGPETPLSELTAALGHDNPRVAVRALHEWCRRGAPADGVDRDLLRRRCQPPAADDDRTWLLGVDFEPEVTAAATLALVAVGETAVDPSPLRMLAPRDVDAEAWLADCLRARRHVELAAAIEARIVDVLRVPAGIAR